MLIQGPVGFVSLVDHESSGEQYIPRTRSSSLVQHPSNESSGYPPMLAVQQLHLARKRVR